MLCHEMAIEIGFQAGTCVTSDPKRTFLSKDSSVCQVCWNAHQEHVWILRNLIQGSRKEPNIWVELTVTGDSKVAHLSVRIHTILNSGLVSSYAPSLLTYARLSRHPPNVIT